MGMVKTTLEIPDFLFRRAKSAAACIALVPEDRKTGRRTRHSFTSTRDGGRSGETEVDLAGKAMDETFGQAQALA